MNKNSKNNKNYYYYTNRTDSETNTDAWNALIVYEPTWTLISSCEKAGI